MALSVGAHAFESNEVAEQSTKIAGTWTEATTALKNENWGAAAGYFDDHLEQNPSNYFAYYLYSLALHGAGDYVKALKSGFVAARYSQVRGRAHYTVARSYAKLEQNELALLWLERAFMAGFDGFSDLASETDFATIKDDPRIARIISTARNDAATKMPVGTSNHESAFDQAASTAEVRTIGGELHFGTGGIAVSRNGEVFVADFGEDLYRISAKGEPELYKSGMEGASGNAFDSHGNLFQAHFKGQKISKIEPNGDVVDFVTEGLSGPVGITIDKNDNLYVANCDGQYISKITPKGQSSIFSRGPLFYCPNGITIDDAGNIFVANYHHGVIVKVTPDGEAAYFRQMPEEGASYVLYLDGALYVTGSKSHRIFKLTPDANMTVIAGAGERGIIDGEGTAAMFADSNGLAASPNGNCLYTNDGAGDWRDSTDRDAYPWHSYLREIKLNPQKSC